MCGGWSFALIMASLPLFGISGYYKYAVCLPFEAEDPLSLGYVVFLMLINGVAFSILMGCYLKMYCAIRGSQVSLNISYSFRNIMFLGDWKMISSFSILGVEFKWLPNRKANGFTSIHRFYLLGSNCVFCIIGILWCVLNFSGAGKGKFYKYDLQCVCLFFKSEIILISYCFYLQVFTIFVLPLNSCCNPFLYAILTKQFKKDCVMICKTIEESRVTRGIGRCRHSSNFSNRQTPANTNSLNRYV